VNQNGSSKSCLRLGYLIGYRQLSEEGNTFGFWVLEGIASCLLPVASCILSKVEGCNYKSSENDAGYSVGCSKSKIDTT